MLDAERGDSSLATGICIVCRAVQCWYWRDGDCSLPTGICIVCGGCAVTLLMQTASNADTACSSFRLCHRLSPYSTYLPRKHCSVAQVCHVPAPYFMYSSLCAGYPCTARSYADHRYPIVQLARRRISARHCSCVSAPYPAHVQPLH